MNFNRFSNLFDWFYDFVFMLFYKRFKFGALIVMTLTKSGQPLESIAVECVFMLGPIFSFFVKPIDTPLAWQDIFIMWCLFLLIFQQLELSINEVIQRWLPYVSFPLQVFLEGTFTIHLCVLESPWTIPCEYRLLSIVSPHLSYYTLEWEPAGFFNIEAPTFVCDVWGGAKKISEYFTQVEVGPAGLH